MLNSRYKELLPIKRLSNSCFMKTLLYLLSLSIGLIATEPNSFKEEQKRYPRVRAAYAAKEEAIIKLLQKKQIDVKKVELYMRAFKHDKLLELWGRNKGDKTFQLLKEYKICRTSGDLGPKRQRGDGQIPEGYYHISVFNPASSYYLSLGVNYPNVSDRILGNKASLGGDIFIHGSCVTIGCIPITDDLIKELYVFSVEAKNNGQKNIPITIFPGKLSNEYYSSIQNSANANQDKLDLWKDLKDGYDFFDRTKTLPDVTFLSSGRHKVYR